jgi:hypothetical protein
LKNPADHLQIFSRIDPDLLAFCRNSHLMQPVLIINLFPKEHRTRIKDRVATDEVFPTLFAPVSPKIRCPSVCIRMSDVGIQKSNDLTVGRNSP